MISLKEFREFTLKIPDNIELIRKHYKMYLEYIKILECEFNEIGGKSKDK